jgi:predicted metal-dependent phosphotriesterase family hydrolase
MPMSVSLSPNPLRQVMTVQGPVPHEQLGITDAHNHVWIAPLPGVSEAVPALDQYDLILQELVEYRSRGGESLVDCQPGGCGRDGNRLLELSRAGRVNIIACTGFHLKKYYPPEYWFWSATARKVCESLCSEMEQGLAETLDSPSPVRAGFIKIALEAAWADCPLAALEGAASAASRTGALVEIHTEKGALAEKACVYFANHSVSPHQLVLCHMDKRPDLSLHIALAGMGALLEYDTFYRPKYNPESCLWPLIEQMVSAGLSNRVALATDMAETALYRHIGGGPGLASLPGEIQEKLIHKGIPEVDRAQMLGGNITRRLAGII